MAKSSAIIRNEKRVSLNKSAKSKRAKLKAIITDKKLPAEERFAAVLKLAEMPRNGARSRIRNRCALTGRPRGYHGKFKLCRNKLRELASTGMLPGVTKSSW